MAFTYDFDTEPAISYVRLLISDTDSQNFVFADAEVNAAITIQGGTFQSAQFYSPPAGANVPASAVSYLRVAALLLDAMAANSSKLAMFTRILDVEIKLRRITICITDRHYRKIRIRRISDIQF